MKIKPIKYLKEQLIDALNSHQSHQDSVPSILLRNAILESSRYAEQNMKDSMIFFNHSGIWDYTISQIKKQEFGGHLLEFGVFTGSSINYFSSQLQQLKFYGFDSFEGLKEDWKGWSLTKGAFDLKGQLPQVNSNVVLIKGWFDSTIPEFIKSNDIRQIQFLHIDCDTYEATNTVFNLLESKINTGTLILFDEYFGYRGWELGEYKSFKEFISITNKKYRYKAFSKCQVLVEIL